MMDCKVLAAFSADSLNLKFQDLRKDLEQRGCQILDVQMQSSGTYSLHCILLLVKFEQMFPVGPEAWPNTAGG